MDIKEMLLENFKKKYEADACLSALENKVKIMAERRTRELYNDFEILRNGYVYRLDCIQPSFCLNHCFTIPDVRLSLIYFCVSKLVKRDREAIKKEQDLLEMRGYKQLSYCTRKKPLFFTNKYDVSLENVLNGEIRLEIK